MRFNRKHGLITVVCLVAAAFQVSAQNQFRLQLISGLSADDNAADDRGAKINDQGQVIGYIPNGAFKQAAIWDQGLITALGVFGNGFETVGYDINNSGRVVGDMDDLFGTDLAGVKDGQSGWQSLLFPTSSFSYPYDPIPRPFRPLSGEIDFTTPAAINSFGEIVGWGTRVGFNSGSREAFYHSGTLDGNTRPIMLPPPVHFDLATYQEIEFWRSMANDITDGGIIVGRAYTNSFDLATPVYWNSNAAFDPNFLSLQNGNPVAGAALGAAGNYIVGFLGSTSGQVATSWTNLGAHERYHWAGRANAVNSSGLIVGEGTDGNAYLAHPEGGVGNTNLNSLHQTTVVLQNATDVNRHGQIVCQSDNGLILAHPEISSIGDGAWDDDNTWFYGVVPDVVHPVFITDDIIDGPQNDTQIAELWIGGDGNLAMLNLGDGRLTVSNDNVTWAAGLTVVQNGGFLSGNGSIESLVVVDNGGVLNPGNSVGTLTIDGPLLMDEWSLLYIEITGDDLNKSVDLIDVNGPFTFSATTIFAFDFSGYTGDFNEVFPFLNTSQITGSSLIYDGIPSGIDIGFVYDGETLALTTTNTNPPQIPGDINGDQCVDRNDSREVMSAIRSGTTDPTMDVNGDGDVNIADARFLATLFTNPRGAPCQ